MIALVDYKTSNLYGPQRFAFSEKVSKLIWEYIKGNKLLETDKTSGTLFGKSGMSTFVGNMLDAIGQARGNEGAINVLRKSYVSSEMDKAGAGMTADERQALAFHMRHSVNTSYKYVRDLAKDGAINVQRLRREVAADWLRACVLVCFSRTQACEKIRPKVQVFATVYLPTSKRSSSSPILWSLRSRYGPIPV